MSTDTDGSASLPVAEMFYTVQGEGPTAGTPAVFIRTGNCNLLCGAPEDPDQAQENLSPNAEQGATWLCDTIEEWKNPTDLSFDEIVDTLRSRGFLGPLQTGRASLVLTGGEPLLHQTALARLVESLPSGVPTIEVETNGTIRPHAPFSEHVDQFNVSPKLANSGMPGRLRIREGPLDWLANDDRATFKFVVSRNEDVEEIETIRETFDIDASDVVLMPAGASRADLEPTAERVAELCKTHGYRYSPRLQVDIYDEATGV